MEAMERMQKEMIERIAKIIASEGFGFDIVSGGEMYTVQSSGADMSKTLFNGNNKSEVESFKNGNIINEIKNAVSFQRHIIGFCRQ